MCFGVGGGVSIGTLHCGRTAGTCIRDYPEEKEGGNIKQHMRMRQHNRTIPCFYNYKSKLQLGEGIQEGHMFK